MQKLRSNIQKLGQQLRKSIRDIIVIRKYDYEKLMKEIEHASYPAGLGAINLILYQYMNTIKIAHFQVTQLFFLLSSFSFFLMAIVVGLGGIENAQEKSLSTQVELKELKHRQTYFIVLAFMFALFFDLLGLILLAAFSF
jgi:hypothetical protein